MELAHANRLQGILCFSAMNFNGQFQEKRDDYL